MTTPAVAVVLYGRDGCHLCELARDALRRLGRDVAFELHEQDVDTDPAPAERYGDRVPVVTVAGREASEGRMDVGAVRRALLEAERAGAVDKAAGRS